MSAIIYTEGRVERPGLVARVLATLAATLVTAGLAFLPTILPAAEAVTVRVEVSDLNLASAAGQRILDQRVRTAIERVCAPVTSELERRTLSRRGSDACREAAWESVRQQLVAHGVPQLVAASR